MIQTIVSQPMLVVGDKVSKIKGYAFDGTVVAVFDTLAGEKRVVVEMPTRTGHGILHIFNESQLEKREELPSDETKQMKEGLNHIRKIIENGDKWSMISAGSLHFMVTDALKGIK